MFAPVDTLTSELPAPSVPLGAEQHRCEFLCAECLAADRAFSSHCPGCRITHHKAMQKVEEELRALYPEFAGGNDRTVFDGGKVVYKVGYQAAQDRELAAYLQPSSVDYLPVAPCRMVYHVSGIPILIMETVRPATPDDDFPAWAIRIDCTQVGLTRDGQWVIFDAGDKLYDEDEMDCEPDWSAVDFLDHEIPSIFGQLPSIETTT